MNEYSCDIVTDVLNINNVNQICWSHYYINEYETERQKISHGPSFQHNDVRKEKLSENEKLACKKQNSRVLTKCKINKIIINSKKLQDK